MTDNEFLEQVEPHRHEFFAFVQRTVWDQSHAEDVFSSAILSAYEKRYYRKTRLDCDNVTAFSTSFTSFSG